jgi:outer membrane protein assembly factor BamB
MEHPIPRRPLRLWPGVLAVALQWLCMFGLPIVAPEQGGAALLAGVAGGLVVLLWWLGFSRAVWSERLLAIVAMAVALTITARFVHESIAGGMMGFLLFLYAVPALSLALVVWAVAGRGLSSGYRHASLVGAIVLACGALTLVRTNGMTGDAASDFEWRWSPTAEQRLLARGDERLAASPPVAPAESPVAVWPGFRGPARDGIVRGGRIATDWTHAPPVLLWRRPIGPGWSSFAVAGERLFTQEQRGDDELVSAYDLGTGDPVWRHRDAARFEESNAGAGPRATPTYDRGRVYTLGATGILNALDAQDGAVVWSRDAVADTGARVPDWGIASSPLVVGEVVVAATAGSLVAYDIATGAPRWFGPKGGWGYSSPHLLTIDGVAQIVLVDGPGAIGVVAADGRELWRHEWRGDGIVQPTVLADGDLLIGSGSGLAANTGVLRLAVRRGADGWTASERWESRRLRPYFSDSVVHDGHAFGFDGGILACIELDGGTRRWKGGRYGHGQLVLLADQGVLLVVTEHGELALVAATPERFSELARVPALEGKTWNHPVLVGDVLLVRNGEQMAAFRLARDPW